MVFEREVGRKLREKNATDVRKAAGQGLGKPTKGYIAKEVPLGPSLKRQYPGQLRAARNRKGTYVSARGPQGRELSEKTSGGYEDKGA